MAAETTYFVALYDNEASGPFVADDTKLTWPGGGEGHIVSVFDDGTTGKLAVALIAGSIPTNDQTLTQGSTTADTNGPASNGDSEPLLYPAHFREDVAVSAKGFVTWTGPALGATHSFFFDGQTANVVAGEILTFSGGQQCEVITVVSDAGASGELDVRWITFVDTLEFPDDNDTFTGDIAGDGTLNGRVYPRCYRSIELHRLLMDLQDDPFFRGDDVVSVVKPRPSRKSTGEIISLLGLLNIDDTVAQHMYGGSVEQDGSDALYSGLAIQVTDSDDGTKPVVIQDDAIVTDYWKEAFMPHSVIGKVRVLRKTRVDGTDINGKRVKAKLLRFGDTYFEASTTLGTGETSLALFSAVDGNNQTAEATVAGAPYNTVVITEGYHEIDFNNGNGLRPFGLSFDIGSATRAQTYERQKWIQREDTSETLFGRAAQLFTGFTIDVPYDTESGNFTEPEETAWGTELPYTPLAVAQQVWQVDDSGGPSFSDQTTGFNDATDANFTPFPATEEDELDYCAIGFQEKFGRVVFDALNGTAGAGGTVAWEYWDGFVWAALTGVTDGTTGFTAGTTDGQVLTFTIPSDWRKNTINAVQAYYIRARVTQLYTTNPVYDQGFIGGDAFAVGEAVVGIASGAIGRVLMHDATNDILIVSRDSGSPSFSSSEILSGAESGIAATAGTVVNNAASGTMYLYALDDDGTTGNLYGQRTRGVIPANNQTVYGATSLETVLVNGTAATRVVNIQMPGVFTGTAFNPGNHGFAIDETDAIAADLFFDLTGAQQSPPDNQVGTARGGNAGDYLVAFAWDGAALDINGDPEPDEDEMQLAVALTGGVTTTVDVGTGNIPDNTPQAGWLRVARDSDGEFERLEYVSHNGDDVFTLGGDTPTAPSNAAIGNNLYRTPLDKTWTTTGVPETYTAVYGGTPNQLGISLLRGGVNPIVPFRGQATFGANGFDVPAQRLDDS